MIVRTILTPSSLDNLSDGGFDVAVVIDVLRATTTLLYAISAGASKIVPVSTLDEAFELEKKYDNAILCGEREGRKVPGFHLGNSPSEYTEESVGGKVIIYASTNGSVMLNKVRRFADKIFLASLRNVGAAANRVIFENPEKLLIACSGLERFFSLEDTYCAGMLIEKIASRVKNLDIDDSTTMARILFQYFSYDIERMFKNSVHARYLGDKLGLKKDIIQAGEIDSDDTVPVFADGEITAR